MRVRDQRVNYSNIDRLLSIITVCRNDALRLEKTINSLSAFYGDQRFEHLVIDGGSTDNSQQLLASLTKTTNFRCYVNADCGIYDAMNLGVSYSRSPFLLFLNCGDTVIGNPDEFYNAFSDLIDRNKIVADIVCFPVREISSNFVKTIVPTRPFFHKMPTSHQGMIFRKQFVNNNCYETRYKIAGDYDLYLRAERDAIITRKLTQSLVAVEAEGYASSHPVRAYFEYLAIACRRLKGARKLRTIFLIMSRALIVITAKLFLPTKWILLLRRI